MWSGAHAKRDICAAHLQALSMAGPRGAAPGRNNPGPCEKANSSSLSSALEWVFLGTYEKIVRLAKKDMDANEHMCIFLPSCLDEMGKNAIVLSDNS